ncbi:MAG: hypothetical protein IRY87_16170 [Acetobacteraceae bacterium]|nr:hypothetical protein [Acetobacteraceae bacterium]
MTTQTLRLLAALGFGAALSVAWPAAAQHPCPGYVSAIALRPVPHDATFNIAGRVDSDAERALRDAVLAELRRQGRHVSDQPTHLLSWRGGLSRDEAGQYGMNEPETGPFHESDDLHWMQDVPSRRSRRAMPGPIRLNGTVELRERASGRVVWTAMLSCERHGADQDALIGMLTSAIVPLIGQSVTGRPF